MKNWKELHVTANQPILKVLEILNRTGDQFVVVVDENDVLLGSVTDGDIRRGLLAGVQIQDVVLKVMNKNPLCLNENASRAEILLLMREKEIHSVPIVDAQKRVKTIALLHDYLKVDKKENEVILLAGGLGTRLGAMTANCPKSMLKVGEKPILETIIETFKDHGFHNFNLSVNYLSDMIEGHFGDGKTLGVQINYLKEEKRLGTAGPLSLYNSSNNLPLIVMNGDLLTKINFSDLVNYHTNSGNEVTLCLRQYDVQIPYGVVTTSHNEVLTIEEKPTKHFLVSSGIYVFNPDLLKKIPEDSFYDMPTFISRLLEDKHKIGAYPFFEYWIDIGRMDDYEKAHTEFLQIFK